MRATIYGWQVSNSTLMLMLCRISSLFDFQVTMDTVYEDTLGTKAKGHFVAVALSGHPPRAWGKDHAKYLKSGTQSELAIRAV